MPDITEDNEPAEDEEDESAAGGAILSMVQGKLAGLLGRSSGYIESLPVEVKRSVEALKGVQIKQNELQNEYKRECLELEKKVSVVCVSSSRRIVTSLHVQLISSDLLPLLLLCHDC